MKYRLFLFGLFFLLNSHFSIFDVLPDFIGLFIIARSIKPLCDISPSAESASIYFKRAAAVSLAQLCLIIPMISVINSDNAFFLVFNFTFNLLRLIFLLPAFGELTNSLIYFAEKHADKKSAVTVARIKALKLVTQLYVVIHCALSVYPDAHVYFNIKDPGHSENITALYPNASERVRLLTDFAHIAVILSIIWFIFVSVQIMLLRKNATINKGIAFDMASAERSEKKRVMSALKPAITCFIISCFCMISYRIDGKSLIPPYFTPILHIATISYLRRIVDKKITRAFSIVAVIVSFPLQLLSEYFATQYHETALFAFSLVESKFILPHYTNIVYTLFLALSTLCVGIALYRTIKEHTGLFWETAYTTHNSKVANERIKQLRLSILLTIASCTLAVFNAFSYGALYSKPMLNTYGLVIGAALGIFASILYTSVRTSVLEKYSTENKMN